MTASLAHVLRTDRLRRDCFAGNGGALVAYYRSAGFLPTDRFLVDGWPGQVLEKAVGP